MKGKKRKADCQTLKLLILLLHGGDNKSYSYFGNSLLKLNLRYSGKFRAGSGNQPISLPALYSLPVFVRIGKKCQKHFENFREI